MDEFQTLALMIIFMSFLSFFQALADRLAIPCSLTRGEYNRAWNIVMLCDDTQTPPAPSYPPNEFLVDLIHVPGRLMRTDSADAVNYQKL